MFGATAGNAGGDYSTYGGQTYGFGPQYTQWPENAANATSGSGGSTGGRGGGYSYLSGGSASDDSRKLVDMQQGLDGMKLKSGKDSSSGVKQTSAPTKMSWASVASQPAKPQPLPQKAKKPGVLPPPSIIPSSKPPLAPQQTPPEKVLPPMSGGQQNSVPQQPPPTIPTGPPPTLPPGPMPNMVMNSQHDYHRPPNMGMQGPPPNYNHGGHHGGHHGGRNMMNNQGSPRRGRAKCQQHGQERR